MEPRRDINFSVPTFNIQIIPKYILIVDDSSYN